MKKLASVLFCVGLCISIAVLIPQVGTSNPTVDETGCLECHLVADLHALHMDCLACHVETGDTPASSTCIVCHPVGDPGACNLVNQHEDAGASCLECHEDCNMMMGCVVTIDCEETTLCTDDDCITCTATTECDGMEVDGVYTWTLNNAAATGNNGSIEVCPEDLDMGDNTLMVVDTANDDAEDSETLTLEECGPTECAIDVIPDSLSKSHWEVSPTVFRIETIGIEDLTAMTPVTIVCDADGDSPIFKSVFKTGKVVLPNFGTNTTVIVQTGIIWPAWWTQSFELESETCTVTVEGCAATDTFELEYRFIFGIPLGN